MNQLIEFVGKSEYRQLSITRVNQDWVIILRVGSMVFNSANIVLPTACNDILQALREAALL